MKERLVLKKLSVLIFVWLTLMQNSNMVSNSFWSLYMVITYYITVASFSKQQSNQWLIYVGYNALFLHLKSLWRCKNIITRTLWTKNIMDLKTTSFLLTLYSRFDAICHSSHQNPDDLRWVVKKEEFTNQGIYLYLRLLFISGSSSVSGEKKESVCTSQGNQAPVRVRHIIASHPLLWYIPQTLSSEFHKHFGNRYRTNAIKKIFHKRFIPISIIIPWTFTLVSSKIFAIAIAILSVQITFHSITFLQ